MLGGEVVEPGPGSGLVPAVVKETQAQSQTSTTHHSAGSYIPSIRLGSPLACHNDPTTLAGVAPPSPPTLAQPGYHKMQMTKVLKHTRAELMKRVIKLRYNDLVVEG